MGTFALRRLGAMFVVMLIVSFLVFSLVLLLPGDPARAIAGGLGAPDEQVDRIRSDLGLADPFPVRYGRWISDVATGDLGQSLFTNRAVATEIRNRFPVTLSIALGAVAVSVLVGFAAGMIAGTRPGSWRDRTSVLGSSVGLAVPDFWFGMVLVVVLAVQLGWLPSIGYVPFTQSPVDWARHLLMPWLAVGAGAAATMTRQVRGALIDVMQQDYVRTARSKGLPPRLVIGKHALKNASMPALTILGIQFGYLLGGTVIIEQIFSLPGLGSLMLQAIVSRDLPVIQGVVLVVAGIFVFLNLVVDLAYAYVNPKVRLA